MMPQLAVVDPLLTVSVPPAITAGRRNYSACLFKNYIVFVYLTLYLATGLDAFTQCLEPLTSCAVSFLFLSFFFVLIHLSLNGFVL